MPSYCLVFENVLMSKLENRSLLLAERIQKLLENNERIIVYDYFIGEVNIKKSAGYNTLGALEKDIADTVTRK